MNFLSLALHPCESTHARGHPASQPLVRLGHPTHMQETARHPQASLPRGGSFAENQNCPHLPSLFSCGCCKPLLLFPAAPGWGEPPPAPCVVGLHCGRVLGVCQGIPAPRSLLMPLRSPYVKLHTLQGTEKNPVWHSPPASLRACSSRAETTQLISAVAENPQPHPVPRMSPQCLIPVPHRCWHLCRGWGSSPSYCPASRRPGEDARTNTPHPCDESWRLQSSDSGM